MTSCPPQRSRPLRPTRSVLLVGVLWGLLAVGCGSGGDTASRRPGDPTTAAASAVASAARAPGRSLSDSAALALLDAAHVADSAAGAVALARGTNGEVRAFGRQMMREHQALRRAGRDVAAILAPSGTTATGRGGAVAAPAWVDTLRAMPEGAAFDRAYLDHAVAHHEAALQTAQRAMDATEDEALRDLLRASAPKVQAHLDRARSLQAKLAGRPAP